MEIFKYKENLASIKDESSDIDIADTQWNFLFDHANKKFTFFSGFRLRIPLDSHFVRLINTFASSKPSFAHEYHSLFLPVEESNLFIRSGIKELWEAYEYPSFILLEDITQIDLLTDLCLKKTPEESITECIKGATIIYKSFEQDVLWLSGDIRHFNLQSREETN